MPPPFSPLTLNEPQPQPLEDVLQNAIEAFIVQREKLQTVIAGYPWFLDWGRDTLICLRGIIAAGRHTQAKAILIAFAKLEHNGTLPNMISGEDHANRETSDAPSGSSLLATACYKPNPPAPYSKPTAATGPYSMSSSPIAQGYINGTENGIHMDATSALIFSPSHFTWMDTNYPAGTPEKAILSKFKLSGIPPFTFSPNTPPTPNGIPLPKRLPIHPNPLSHPTGQRPLPRRPPYRLCRYPAHKATPDDALRPNQLFAITLGALVDPLLQRNILQATEKLLIPGAIRSLADQPVEQPLPIYHHHQLVNDPHHPYQGIYIGEEDTQRKPAYHNGTAWSWPFPSYAEALLQTYGSDVIPHARAFSVAQLSYSKMVASATSPKFSTVTRHTPNAVVLHKPGASLNSTAFGKNYHSNSSRSLPRSISDVGTPYILFTQNHQFYPFFKP